MTYFRKQEKMYIESLAEDAHRAEPRRVAGQRHVVRGRPDSRRRDAEALAPARPQHGAAVRARRRRRTSARRSRRRCPLKPFSVFTDAGEDLRGRATITSASISRCTGTAGSPSRRAARSRCRISRSPSRRSSRRRTSTRLSRVRPADRRQEGHDGRAVRPDRRRRDHRERDRHAQLQALRHAGSTQAGFTERSTAPLGKRYEKTLGNGVTVADRPLLAARVLGPRRLRALRELPEGARRSTRSSRTTATRCSAPRDFWARPTYPATTRSSSTAAASATSTT